MPTIKMRGGNPAIDVKDRTLWARHPVAGPLLEELSSEETDSIYEQVREEFWDQDVPHIAASNGLDPDDFYSEGRMGGWLVYHGAGFLNYINMEDPDPSWIKQCTAPPEHVDVYDAEAYRARKKYLSFAREIEGAIEEAGRYFVERLSEAKAELDANREACLVRGEN
jgi:hypothetical protein